MKAHPDENLPERLGPPLMGTMLYSTVMSGSRRATLGRLCSCCRNVSAMNSSSDSRCSSRDSRFLFLRPRFFTCTGSAHTHTAHTINHMSAGIGVHLVRGAERLCGVFFICNGSAHTHTHTSHTHKKIHTHYTHYHVSSGISVHLVR